MHRALIVIGALIVAGVLLDAFQTIILPRRPVGRFRITRVFFLATWQPWLAITRAFGDERRQDRLNSAYGPMALLLLLAVWASLLVFGFGMVYFGLQLPFVDALGARVGATTEWQRLRACFYVSGSNLFTLGLGDVTPRTQTARLLSVLEAATGLGFFALVIGYVPVLYTAFSAREVSVALLDARAGSPPTASELLVRHRFEGGGDALGVLLAEWERWCAGLLETHISYPILCYYRSQHDNQSWLAALTAVLDACALLITVIDGPQTRQAELTFAVGRHALVDIGHVFRREKREAALRASSALRLADDDYARLCDELKKGGYDLCKDPGARQRLVKLRQMYEPHAEALAEYLRLALPLWTPPPPDPARKPSMWDAVANLRSPAAAQREGAVHISPQATATHLDDSELHSL